MRYWSIMQFNTFKKGMVMLVQVSKLMLLVVLFANRKLNDASAVPLSTD